MTLTEYYKNEILQLLSALSEEKISELYDFAQFLAKQRPASKSQVDEAALHLQKKSLEKIWEDPEEDIYEL